MGVPTRDSLNASENAAYPSARSYTSASSLLMGVKNSANISSVSTCTLFSAHTVAVSRDLGVEPYAEGGPVRKSGVYSVRSVPTARREVSTTMASPVLGEDPGPRRGTARLRPLDRSCPTPGRSRRARPAVMTLTRPPKVAAINWALQADAEDHVRAHAAAHELALGFRHGHASSSVAFAHTQQDEGTRQGSGRSGR